MLNFNQIGRFRSTFNDARTVCILDKEEFINLLYAMYQSPHSSLRHKQVLERILENNQ